MTPLQKYRFSSKEWEQNAGLYYYGFRFYDSNLQRWLNRDPLDEVGFERLYFVKQFVSVVRGQGAVIGDLILIAALARDSNPFEIVGNDPLGAADWQGLWWGIIPTHGEDWGAVWDWTKEVASAADDRIEWFFIGNDTLKCGEGMYNIYQYEPAKYKYSNDPNNPTNPVPIHPG